MCDFCEELGGRDFGEFGRRHGATESRVVWVDDELALLPTLGPLAPGHLLVVPREHFTSFASLPRRLRRLTERLVAGLDVRVRSQNGELLWFEHGSSGPGSSGGCGIAHAHLHVLPLRSGWRRPALPSGLSFVAAPGENWLDVPAPRSDYLLVGQTNDVSHAVVDQVPSQALRRWLAPAVGARAWDWRTSEPDPDIAAEVARARQAIADLERTSAAAV